MVVDPVFANFLRSNTVYANPDCTKYSLTKLDETYMKFNEGIERRYPGYALDDNFLVVNKNDIAINFDEIKKVFLLTELGTYEDLKQKFFGS